jgi:hypothetical protein
MLCGSVCSMMQHRIAFCVKFFWLNHQRNSQIKKQVLSPLHLIMKSVIFALLAGAAAAFAPVAQKASSSALHMAFESEIGAQPPLGFFVS